MVEEKNGEKYCGWQNLAVQTDAICDVIKDDLSFLGIKTAA